MSKDVSVEEAVSRGKRVVNIPVYLILVGLPGIAVFLLEKKQIDGWIAAALAVMGFVCAWLWWSFAIPKWRLWAFANVRNINQLKAMAIQEQLIWPDGSWFAKTEIWSAEQRRQWVMLNTNFAARDVFQDDVTVPYQTDIYFSKFKSIGASVMGALCLAAGFYIYTEDGFTRVTWMAFILGSVIILYGLFNLRNRTPQIILNNDGIQLANTDFYRWKDVKGERIEVTSGGQAGGGRLVFFTEDDTKSIDIAELAIGRTRLGTLLRIYRGRDQKKFSAKTRFR